MERRRLGPSPSTDQGIDEKKMQASEAKDRGFESLRARLMPSPWLLGLAPTPRQPNTKSGTQDEPKDNVSRQAQFNEGICD